MYETWLCLGIGQLQYDGWICFFTPSGTKINESYQSVLLNLIQFCFVCIFWTSGLIRTAVQVPDCLFFHFKSSAGVATFPQATSVSQSKLIILLVLCFFSLLQISSMRTWRWGQTGRATRRQGLPLMRCSPPQVFAWGTEGTGASLQRWHLFLCFQTFHCSSFVWHSALLIWGYAVGSESLVTINKLWRLNTCLIWIMTLCSRLQSCLTLLVQPPHFTWSTVLTNSLKSKGIRALFSSQEAFNDVIQLHSVALRWSIRVSWTHETSSAHIISAWDTSTQRSSTYCWSEQTFEISTHQTPLFTFSLPLKPKQSWGSRFQHSSGGYIMLTHYGKTYSL